MSGLDALFGPLRHYPRPCEMDVRTRVVRAYHFALNDTRKPLTALYIDVQSWRDLRNASPAVDVTDTVQDGSLWRGVPVFLVQRVGNAGERHIHFATEEQ